MVWGGAPAKIEFGTFSLKIWHLVATNLKIFLRINWPNFLQNFQILWRIWKHVNSATHWIPITSKAVTGHYGSSTAREWSVRSAVCFWCTHCFVWGRVTLTVGVWSQKWGIITVTFWPQKLISTSMNPNTHVTKIGQNSLHWTNNLKQTRIFMFHKISISANVK